MEQEATLLACLSRDVSVAYLKRISALRRSVRAVLPFCAISESRLLLLHAPEQVTLYPLLPLLLARNPLVKP